MTKEFHANLKARGRGAKDWGNSWTEQEYLGDEKFSATISAGHRVFKDKTDGLWKRHKLTDNRSIDNHVLIQSAQCAVEVYPYYAKYFDVDHEEVRLYEERWVVQRWRTQGGGSWGDVGAWNPVTVVEQRSDYIKVTVTYDTDYGPLVVNYLQYDGNALKHTVTFTNTSAETETFRVLQRWVGIAGSKVKHDKGEDVINGPKTIDGTAFRFLKADGSLSIYENQSSMVYESPGVLLTDHNLQSVDVDVHPSGMKVDFIFGSWTLAQGENLEIDPDTATLDTPTEDAYTYLGRGNKITGDEMTMGTNPTNTRNYRTWIEWDVTSIPDGVDVTDTVFKYHGSTNNEDGHIHAMLTDKPSTVGADACWTDAGDGTVYADVAGFPVVGTNQQVDLGTAADSDLEGQLAANWFAIGLQGDSEGSADTQATIYSQTKSSVTPPPTLYVEYSLAAVSGAGGHSAAQAAMMFIIEIDD